MVQITPHSRYYWQKFDKKVEEFNRPRQMPDYFGPMLEGKEESAIAELGCALVNTIGDEWEGVKINLVCSDKYADSFNSMWEEKGITPRHPIHTEDMENLSYAEKTFDIVHCRNALDHTEDALKAIEEMKRVTKDWVYLIHAPDQMTRFGGHHYWDVRFEDGQTVFYGKEYSFIPSGFESHVNSEGLIVSIWRK